MSKEEALIELKKNISQLTAFKDEIAHLESAFRGGDVSFSMAEALKNLDPKEFNNIVANMRKVVKSRLTQKLKEI